MAVTLMACPAEIWGQPRKSTTAAAPPAAPPPTAPSVASPSATTFSATSSPATTLPSTAAAATTSSATTTSAAWAQSVQSLAQLLAGQDLAGVSRALDPTPAIRSFSSEALQSPGQMVGAVSGAKLLGVHAYDATPRTLASDLADDFSSAGDAVPERTRREMTPPDDAAAKRANETAGNWVASVLRTAEKEQPVGVIVLWPPERSSRVEGPARRAIFVLLRGRKIDDRIVFDQVVFGDPLETPR
ncbi:MAG: hypothetical protein ABIP55_01285 [Tepidisphaeraceae bacterium]